MSLPRLRGMGTHGVMVLAIIACGTWVVHRHLQATTYERAADRGLALEAAMRAMADDAESRGSSEALNPADIRQFLLFEAGARPDRVMPRIERTGETVERQYTVVFVSLARSGAVDFVKQALEAQPSLQLIGVRQEMVENPAADAGEDDWRWTLVFALRST